ncbi:MAG: hypothetical protein LQ344_003021 [Seirophora lacunosa]|nr:MAG: hypothetical protein LQ344_003021 [Seirophora lacunosa]
MAILQEARDSVTGGCLCGAVRYTVDFPKGSNWPPQSHLCQCTQCRKQSGALISHFMTLGSSQLRWANPSDGTAAAEPYKEFSSSKGVYRGFCSACGTAILWRSEENAEEIDLFIGSIDEKWLIGDRTEKVSSESLTEPGVFEKVLSADEGALGRAICTPQMGQMFVRNAIKGVTDARLVGKRFVEMHHAKMEIPD